MWELAAVELSAIAHGLKSCELRAVCHGLAQFVCVKALSRACVSLRLGILWGILTYMGGNMSDSQHAGCVTRREFAT
jgi:hypothetical protein